MNWGKNAKRCASENSSRNRDGEVRREDKKWEPTKGRNARTRDGDGGSRFSSDVQIKLRIHESGRESHGEQD